MPIDNLTWKPATVTADNITWSDASDTIEGSRWIAALDIAGVLLHLEARRVSRTNDDNMVFDEWPEDLDALEALYSDTVFTTGTGEQLGLPDGDYILFAYPYGR